jgi:hypothetical protein
MLGHTMNKNVMLYINEVAVSENSDTYAIRAAMDEYLFSSPQNLTNFDSMALYRKDTYQFMDEPNPFAPGAQRNDGLHHRAQYFRGSRRVQMAVRFHLDLCHQERPLLNDVDIRLKITPNSDAFNLMSSTANADYRLEVLSAKLLVRMVRPKPETVLGHIAAIRESPAKYPIRRKVVKRLTTAAGVSEFSKDDIFQGSKPDRVIIAGVSGRAVAGSYVLNPINFSPCEVSRISLSVNGKAEPMGPLDVDHVNGRNMDAYLALFIGCDRTLSNRSIQINRHEYGSGYTLYAWDLTPDLSANSFHRSIQEGTSVNLKLNFHNPTAQSYTFFILGVFHNTIEINERREVMLDWSA